MEISFTQEITFSTTVSDDQVRQLADRMELDIPTFRDLVNGGELLKDKDREDHVIDWIGQLEDWHCRIENKEDPDNVEISD